MASRDNQSSMSSPKVLPKETPTKTSQLPVLAKTTQPLAEPSGHNNSSQLGITTPLTVEVAKITPVSINITSATTKFSSSTHLTNSTSISTTSAGITSVSTITTFITSVKINGSSYPTVTAASEQLYLVSSSVDANHSIHTAFISMETPITCINIPSEGWKYLDNKTGQWRQCPGPAPGRKGPPAGQIAGITIAVVVLLGLALAAWCVYTRKRPGPRRHKHKLGWMRPKAEMRDLRRDSNLETQRGFMEINTYPRVASDEQIENQTEDSTNIIYSNTSAPLNRISTIENVPNPGRGDRKMKFDLEKDDDSILSAFTDVDERLRRHIEAYYVTDDDVPYDDAVHQSRSIPAEELSLLEEQLVLSPKYTPDMIRLPRLRRLALRAIASYYLYSAVMDWEFLPDNMKGELGRIRTSTQGSLSSSGRADQRILLYHHFHKNIQNSTYSALVSGFTSRLDSVLKAFKIAREDDEDDSKRLMNLTDVVRRFAELSIMLGKQPDVFMAELRCQDFSSAEVGEEKARRPRKVRYAGALFDEESMKAEYDDGRTDVQQRVRAVVAPGLRKYSLELGKVYKKSVRLRKAKVILL